MINGVRTQVLWDRDIQEGALVEEELAFWAQDDFGNVWLFGEYPEEHEGNKVSAPSTWLAGNQGSAAGILMRANPMLNTSTYKQGEAPSVEFLDLARVHAANLRRCVPGPPSASTASSSSTSGTRTSSRRTGTSSSTTPPAWASSR